MIDLRSDTVTRPVKGMLDAMFAAPVGDDVFGEDPTVNLFQEKVAAHLGHEAGLFCPSGTMANQIAIRVHCRPGDEVICSDMSHIYLYEGGGVARNAGASVKFVSTDFGRLSAKSVESGINPDDAHFPVTRLVSLEDTMNKGGGCTYDLNEIVAIRALCDEKKLGLHLDGARVMNALVATGNDPVNYGKNFDSISICFSKGLGCPVGSVLVGSRDFIQQAHRVRKSFGGGMRQAGILAAAGLYALEHHVGRLAEDHGRAAAIAEALSDSTLASEVLPVSTNIVVIKTNESPAEVLRTLEEKHIRAVPFGSEYIRMVTHHDFSDADLQQVCDVLRNWD